MKRFGVVLAFTAMAVAAAAYPGLSPDVSEDSNVDPVDRAIRHQSAEFLQLKYAEADHRPQLDGSSEVIEELIVASLPESIRQAVADELQTGSGAVVLSDELKERINQHILDWALQYVPGDLRVDIRESLEEYRTTGRVSGNNDQLVERVRQYVARLDGRRKRGVVETIVIVAAINAVDRLFKKWG